MTVEYRDIVGFPGYRVGDDGSVWSRWHKKRNGRCGSKSVLVNSWRRLVVFPSRYGYACVEEEAAATRVNAVAPELLWIKAERLEKEGRLQESHAARLEYSRARKAEKEGGS